MTYALDHPKATRASKESHGFETLIYTGVDQHAWKPVIEHLGDLLYRRGEVDEPSAQSIEEGQGYAYMFGSNSFLTVSNKTRQLGWQPKQQSIIEALDAALAM